MSIGIVNAMPETVIGQAAPHASHGQGGGSVKQILRGPLWGREMMEI